VFTDSVSGNPWSSTGDYGLVDGLYHPLADGNAKKQSVARPNLSSAVVSEDKEKPAHSGFSLAS